MANHGKAMAGKKMAAGLIRAQKKLPREPLVPAGARKSTCPRIIAGARPIQRANASIHNGASPNHVRQLVPHDARTSDIPWPCSVAATMCGSRDAPPLFALDRSKTRCSSRRHQPKTGDVCRGQHSLVKPILQEDDAYCQSCQSQESHSMSKAAISSL